MRGKFHVLVVELMVEFFTGGVVPQDLEINLLNALAKNYLPFKFELLIRDILFGFLFLEGLYGILQRELVKVPQAALDLSVVGSH